MFHASMPPLQAQHNAVTYASRNGAHRNIIISDDMPLPPEVKAPDTRLQQPFEAAVGQLKQKIEQLQGDSASQTQGTTAYKLLEALERFEASKVPVDFDALAVTQELIDKINQMARGCL